jgi:hypothetical protein
MLDSLLAPEVAVVTAFLFWAPLGCAALVDAIEASPATNLMYSTTTKLRQAFILLAEFFTTLFFLCGALNYPCEPSFCALSILLRMILPLLDACFADVMETFPYAVHICGALSLITTCTG